MSEPCTLYYVRIRIDGHTVYKIGVTKHHDVVSRFKHEEGADVTVLGRTRYPTRREALRAEKGMLRRYKAHRWKGRRLLSSGNSELFRRDVRTARP